jgi:hypothetical protein
MDENEHDTPGEGSDESVEEMMAHLEEAKQLEDAETRRARRNNTSSSLQDKVRRRSDAAVLASNHESRLEEIATNEKVTHRSGKPWASAAAGVEAHGRLPIYYRLDGTVTHRGYISRIVIDPDENTAAADELIRYVTDADTYSDYNDRLDTTTFVVTGGEQLDEPFPQSELQKLSGKGTVSEEYSRQPAYVVQRKGDFPDFP